MKSSFTRRLSAVFLLICLAFFWGLNRFINPVLTTDTGIPDVCPAVVLLLSVIYFIRYLRWLIPPLGQFMRYLQRMYSASEEPHTTVRTHWRLWSFASRNYINNFLIYYNLLMAKSLHISRPFLLWSIFLFSQALTGQISGIVFQDYNGNGIYETVGTLVIADGTSIPTAVDKGVSGVLVNAYNSSNLIIASYTTNSSGAYSIPSSGAYNNVVGSNTGSVGAGVAVRLEFVLPADYKYTPVGTNNNTSVRFVSGGTNNVDFAINKPWEHAANNANLVTNCFVPLAHTGTNANMDVLVSLQQNTGSSVYQPPINGDPGNQGCGGSNPPCPTGFNQPPPTHLASHMQMGSTWGLAWQPSTQTVYAGAFVKQFSDLGPGGTGAIYKVDASDLSNPSVTGYIDLNAIMGANTAGPNPFTTPSYPDYNIPADLARIRNAVYKVGLGDVDISEDESEIYVVNLYDHKIYTIPVDGSPINNTTVKASLTTIPFFMSGASWDDVNLTFQFALAVHNGKVYVGSQNQFNPATEPDYNIPTYEHTLRIYEYDPATRTFNPTPVLSYTSANDPGNAYDLSSQVLTDIIFDAEGGMTLAFRYSYNDIAGGAGGASLLKAHMSGGIYVLDNDYTYPYYANNGLKKQRR